MTFGFKRLVWLQNIFLVLFSLVLVFLLCEGFFRLFPQMINPPQGLFWAQWGFSKDDLVTHSRDYNSLFAYEPDVGFIDRDLVKLQAFPQISKDQLNVMFLGDSVTDLRMYSEELRKNLMNNFTKAPLSFVTASAAGWGTSNERAYLEKYGNKLKPHLVILQMHYNDFELNPVILRQSDGSWLAFNSGVFWEKINRTFLTQSSFMKFLFFKFSLLRKEGDSNFYPENLERELRKIKSLSLQFGFDVVVVAIPRLRKMSSLEEFYKTHLDRILENTQLRYGLVDLRESLGMNDLSSFQLHPGDDAHPNFFLAKKIADAAAPYVMTTLEKRLPK